MKKENEINDLLDRMVNKLRKQFPDNLKCLILYGSWAKGIERKDSDIDLIAIFERLEKGVNDKLWELKKHLNTDREIEILVASVDDFEKEKLPVYTAIKREGRILWGEVDTSIKNSEQPEIKYREFFEKSKEFETRKVKIAEEILKDHPSYGTADLCFVASKHAIQMALAMKGEGYSSKIFVLLPLAEKYFGKEVANAFRKLLELYEKSEYGLEFLTPEEAKLAVRLARKVLNVYNIIK